MGVCAVSADLTRYERDEAINQSRADAIEAEAEAAEDDAGSLLNAVQCVEPRDGADALGDFLYEAFNLGRALAILRTGSGLGSPDHAKRTAEKLADLYDNASAAVRKAALRSAESSYLARVRHAEYERGRDIAEARAEARA